MSVDCIVLFVWDWLLCDVCRCVLLAGCCLSCVDRRLWCIVRTLLLDGR